MKGVLAETGLATDNIKLFELHASKPSHLAEIFQFYLPNGFFLNQEAIESLEHVWRNLRRGNYSDTTVTADDVDEAIDYLQSGSSPPERIEYLEDLEDSASNWKVEKKVREARQKQEEIRDRLVQSHEKVTDNEDVPNVFQEAYSQGESQSFDIKVFTPISDDMPSGEVPGFFEPFAVPADSFKKHSLERSLEVVHTDKFRRYQDIYENVAEVGDTSFADLKNVEELSGADYEQEVRFGNGEKITVTKPVNENQSIGAFQRDWQGMFQTQGVICSSSFEDKLRPKLKEEVLSDENDIVTLYTGYLRSNKLRKFVMTYFLETLIDIIQNLSEEEAENLDRKFVVSLLEAQSAVKAKGEGTRKMKEDEVFNRFISDVLDDSGHYNLEFWFDVKPAHVHPVLLSKCKNRVVTRMEMEDLQEHFSSWSKDFRADLREAFNNRYYLNLDKDLRFGNRYELGFGFVYLKQGKVPEWTRKGRTTYGHRIPCQRMCVQDPVEKFGGGGFEFFLDEMGMKDRDETISFEDYQERLFEEDWKSAEDPYREARKENQEEEEDEDGVGEREYRKKLACEKLKSKVNDMGRIPSEWKPLHQEIRDELEEEDVVDSDFQYETVEKYTKEIRRNPEEHFDLGPPDDFDKDEAVEELKRKEKFLFGATSKEEKIYLAKEYLAENYDVSKEQVEDLAEDVAKSAWMDLKMEDLMEQSHKPDVDREEFREIMGLNVDTDQQDVSEESNNDSETIEEEEGDEVEEEDEEGGEVEPPGEEWSCSCGALNQGDRSVCWSCSKTYEENSE